MSETTQRGYIAIPIDLNNLRSFVISRIGNLSKFYAPENTHTAVYTS